MSDFWHKFGKALGLSPTWWRWRWMNFKKRLAAFFSTDKNVVRHLRSGQKICRNCGALAGAEERRCSVCGARLPSAAGSFLYKVFGLIMPGVAPATAAVTAVIGINFLVQIISSGGRAVLSPGVESLVNSGALVSELVAAGQWWRLLTCVFVHIGIIHFLFNMYALLSVSSFLEEELGAARFLSLFLLTGLGGSIASYLLHIRVISAGASGAIFGLIGFSISYFRRQGSARGRDIQGFMLRWALYAFVFGLFVGADNYAHGGGFVAGFLLGSFMELRQDERRRRDPMWKTLAFILSALLALGFVLLALPRPVNGCTIFTIAKGGRVLAGNNEDWLNPRTRMWFVPATDTTYGIVYFGFDDLFHQGGMNDRGLFFDANALDRKKLPAPGRPAFKGDLLGHIMETCATVEEVIGVFGRIDARSLLDRAQFQFADRTGDAVVIESGGPIRIAGGVLVSTNFRRSEISDGNWPCRRYRTALAMLSAAEAAGPEVVVDALEATATPVTQYSNVFDLSNLVVHLYHFHDFNNPVVVDLRVELAKGRHVVEIPKLFPENPDFETYLAQKNPRKLDGVYTVRWRNGNPRQQLTYKNGVLNGTFIEWDRDGNIVARIEFENGKIVQK